MIKKLSNNSREFGILLFVLSTAISIAAFVFRDYFKNTLSLGLLGIFTINFFSSATFFISGPAFLTVVAGGAIYPPLLVAFVASLGTTAGDTVSFFFGYSTRHIIQKKYEDKLWFKTLNDVFKVYATLIIFLAAIIPNPFFDGVALLVGFFKYDIKKYFAIVLIARFIRFTLLAGLGGIFK